MRQRSTAVPVRPTVAVMQRLGQEDAATGTPGSEAMRYAELEASVHTVVAQVQERYLNQAADIDDERIRIDTLLQASHGPLVGSAAAAAAAQDLELAASFAALGNRRSLLFTIACSEMERSIREHDSLAAAYVAARTAHRRDGAAEIDPAPAFEIDAEALVELPDPFA